jgi:hypothetical protein
MKDIYKNPGFYYVLVPVLVALWPILVWAVYLPGGKENWKADRDKYKEAQEIIDAILARDSSRLKSDALKKGGKKFEYASAIDQAARLCGLSSAHYEYSSKRIQPTKRGKTQNCRVVLKDVGITEFAKFLSTIQSQWADLGCEKLRLTRTRGPDAWRVDIDFKYYY